MEATVMLLWMRSRTVESCKIPGVLWIADELLACHEWLLHIIIIIVCYHFIQGAHYYVPETNSVPMVCMVAVIVVSQYMVHVIFRYIIIIIII